MSTRPEPDNLPALITQIEAHLDGLDYWQLSRRRSRLLACALAALKKVAQKTENSVDTLKEGC